MFCWLTALLLGFLQAWGRRHESADGLAYMSPDGISYLDIGDAYMRGDWYIAVNAMWSPCYSWLTGLWLRLFKPSSFWEFTFVRLLNFLIYAVALLSFAYFLRVLRRDRQLRVTGIALPEWSWLVFGYTIFIWTSLFMNRVSRTSPDLLVAALIFLASGLLLRIRAAASRWQLFAALGIVLGVGYLTKTIMFPLAFVFIFVAYLLARHTMEFKPALLRTAISLLVFLTLATPFLVVLSRARHRFTIGDSARLNYAWYVNGTTRFTHWQGEPPDSGTPVHPTRKIFAAPAVYEFSAPPGISYPPWYDASYWYEGVTPHFNLRQQLTAIARNLTRLYHFLFYRFFLGALTFALFVLLYQSGRRRIVMQNLSAYWFLIVPALTALAIYLAINIEPRYLAPFVAVIALSCVAAFQLAASDETRRLVSGVCLGLVLVFVVSVIPETARSAYSAGRDLSSGNSAARDVQWQVAQGLRQHGLQTGDRVASVGNTMFAAWPRLARVRVVAEVPETPGDEAKKFWAVDEQIRAQALAAIASTNARVIVAENAPSWASEEGWQRLGTTNYLIYVLQ
ncbi:MAG TPA: hypothetical protein VFH15_14025 [Pyrinomonadaceae bacterium]|nr:hypothetical protein [Pyrinomonadaceae bacterium]